ncbi:MAG TPA: penicillin-insensitive murein endopeptidase [Hyphomicrobiales bacterium]|nr:penicillin-insensitive murein endopeptidase [Hyphomicrobiales bacterium]
MRIAQLAGALLALAVTVLPAAAATSAVPAKLLFGAVKAPSPPEGPHAIGFYARGCLAGASTLPLDGPDWQVMRLSRNRHYGTAQLVQFIERFAAKVPRVSSWHGLLIGDMSQPRGGPMPTGHASHQIGLDVDIWLTAMPAVTLSYEQRETMAAKTVVAPDHVDLLPGRWSADDIAVLKAAASDPAVERIFVNAAIKKELCRVVPKPRPWLAKLRPWFGHDEHFHVRLACPPGERDCKGQPPSTSDGCDASLNWWFTDAALHPKPGKPGRPVTLADLPKLCRAVLEAK